MKLICNGQDLSEAVSKVIKAASTRSTNSILEGIKLSAEAGTLSLTATDTELTIKKSIVADVKIEGETVVPGRFFAEFVRKLSKEQIELLLDEKQRLRIKYTDSEGVFQCLSAEEYPEISDVSDSEYFVIERKELKDMIVKTAFSVSQDDSRPMLKGVFFEISQGNASAVALDGYRLAKCVKSIEKTTALMTATVPQKCINEIAKLLDDTSDPATVFIHKNYLKVDLGHTEIISRLISEDFINYKQIIPSMFGTIVTLPAAQFESGLERAILLSRIEKNNLVRFDIKNDLLVLSSSSDIGNITEKIPVNLNGNDLSIAFNARYYTELLKFIGSENIVIKFTNAVSPCIVTPSGDSDDLLYLILPVRMVG